MSIRRRRVGRFVSAIDPSFDLFDVVLTCAAATEKFKLRDTGIQLLKDMEGTKK